MICIIMLISVYLYMLLLLLCIYVGRFYAQAIRKRGLEFDVIFGPAYKGTNRKQ